jgi:hypothetical protein
VKRLVPLFLLAACGAHAPSPATVDNHVSNATGDYLVWTVSSQGQAETRWLDASGQERGRALGVLIASGGHLYRLDENHTSTQLRTCDQLDNDDHGPPAGESSDGTILQLTPLDGGEPLHLDDAIPDDSYSSLSYGATLQASFGPYLFVETAMEEYACGAHGSNDVGAQIFDLQARSAIAPMVKDGDGALAPLTAQAYKDLSEDSGDLSDGSVHVGEMRPVWRDGATQMSYLLWIDACYACGNGNWSSYTSGDWYTSATLPPQLASLPTLPAPIERALESGAQAGVSWGQADEGWRRVFTAR